MNEVYRISELPVGMAYQWRPIPGLDLIGDADEVGRHLEALAEEKGGLVSTDDVLDDARDPRSPVHSIIEWDDETAAEKYRHWQTRALMGAIVRVAIETDGKKQREIVVRNFVNVQVDGQRYYSPMVHVIKEGALSDQYIGQLEGQLKSWRKKAADFERFGGIVSAIDEYLQPAIEVNSIQ